LQVIINNDELNNITEEIFIEVLNEMLFTEIDGNTVGATKKKLRKIDGKLKIVRKRKRPLPLSQRTINPAAARRRARKSAISRKGKQRRITKKAVKTTGIGRKRGLYKSKG
tara:strand:- start:3035 stop:3367 length:333 start_codon:yes stop_codon:yes gene_type:complete